MIDFGYQLNPKLKSKKQRKSKLPNFKNITYFIHFWFLFLVVSWDLALFRFGIL
jgi:hypothetical protein